MHYESLVEETIFIELPDTGRLKIKGLLRGTLDKPLVVMVHGRTGKANSLLEYLGARYLSAQGFATLRLAMYDSSPGTRNILDCTLETHVADFDTVIDYFRAQNVKTLFATGHSYGGATILKSRSKLDGAVLWDPTHGEYWTEHPDSDEDYPERVIDGMIIGLSGNGYVYPQAMDGYDRASGDTTAWVSHKGYPLEIISAGLGSMTHLGAKYIAAADGPKRHVVIEDAHHQFEDSDAVMLRLFEETTTWFKEILDAERR